MIHYQVYERGRIGMCNALMSVENALVMALLTNQEVTFYQNGSLFNSEQGLTLFDLYDIDYPHIVVNGDYSPPPIKSLPFDLFYSVLYKERYPDKEFLNGRTNIIEIPDSDFRTLDSNTLGFYSYMFSLSKGEKHKIHEFLSTRVRPKSKYEKLALTALLELPKFNCINVRRGDYLWIPNNKNNQIEVEHFMPMLMNTLNDDPLLVVSDETDRNYFKLLEQHFNVKYIQDYLPLGLDSAEKGLVAMIVASYSAKFFGSMKSTFSGMIQRYRMYNGLSEDFRYLYSQHSDLVLDNGKIKEEFSGKYSWNRINLPKELKDINFWFIEHQECFK